MCWYLNVVIMTNLRNFQLCNASLFLFSIHQFMWSWSQSPYVCGIGVGARTHAYDIYVCDSMWENKFYTCPATACECQRHIYFVFRSLHHLLWCQAVCVDVLYCVLCTHNLNRTVERRRDCCHFIIACHTRTHRFHISIYGRCVSIVLHRIRTIRCTHQSDKWAIYDAIWCQSETIQLNLKYAEWYNGWIKC